MPFIQALPLTSSLSRIHYGWVVLATGTLVVFGCLGLARFGYSVVLPAMQTALGMDNTQAGMLATANLIGYLGLSAIGGALASRFGPRAVIAAGLGLAGVAMVLTGLAEPAPARRSGAADRRRQWRQQCAGGGADGRLVRAAPQGAGHPALSWRARRWA